MPKLNELVTSLKAAGETTRLRLLAMLAGGELPVKDITEILDQSQPRVSRHLRLLVDAGLVERHAEGAWAYFGLIGQGPQSALVADLVASLDADDAQLRDDQRRLQQIRKNQRTQAASYFAEVAEGWDALRNLHAPEEAVEQAIVEIAGGREANLLIDLGTGTGRMLELLASSFQQCIGIDTSREMIAIARAKMVTAGIGHAQIRLSDISALNTYAGRADLVVLHQVLHYFDDPGKIIADARGPLAAGGRMLIVDFAPHNLEFLRNDHAHRRLGLSKAQIKAWAAAAGLVVTEYKDFPGQSEAESLTVCLWMLEGAEIKQRSNAK